MIADHGAATGSPRAHGILEEWKSWRPQFHHLVPHDIAARRDDLPLPLPAVAA